MNKKFNSSEDDSREPEGTIEELAARRLLY